MSLVAPSHVTHQCTQKQTLRSFSVKPASVLTQLAVEGFVQYAASEVPLKYRYASIVGLEWFGAVLGFLGDLCGATL